MKNDNETELPGAPLVPNAAGDAKSVSEPKASKAAPKAATVAKSDSEQKDKPIDTSLIRYDAMPAEKLPGFTPEEKRFDLLIDGVPYLIRSTPFLFNDEWRFRISVNGDEGHVFTWDSEEGMLRGIDDASSVLPIGLEEAISEKLQSR